MFTPVEESDHRYHNSSPLTKGIQAHPKDWIEVFGREKPFKYTFTVKQTGRVIDQELYPDYCPYDGWRWITKGKFERKKMFYEGL